MDLGWLAAGLAKGLAQGHQAGVDRKLREEQQKSKERQLKLKTQAYEQKLRIMDQLSQVLGGGQKTAPQVGSQPQAGPRIGAPTGQPPQIGAPGQGAPASRAMGLLEVLTGNPAAMMVIPELSKYATAVGAYGRLGEQVRNNQTQNQLSLLRYLETLRQNQFQRNKAAAAVTYGEQKQENGDVVQIARPTYPGLGGGGGSSAPVVLKPAQKKMPIPSADLPLWVNADDLSSPPPGTTPEQAKKKGFTRVSTGQLNAAGALRSIFSVLDRMDDLIEKVYPQMGGVRDRFVGGGQRALEAFLQTDPDAALLHSLLRGTLPGFIKAMGEVGNLNETEQERGAELLPKLTDSADVARKKAKQLRVLFEDRIKTILRGRTKPTLTPKKAAQQAVQALNPRGALPQQFGNQGQAGQKPSKRLRYNRKTGTFEEVK